MVKNQSGCLDASPGAAEEPELVPPPPPLVPLLRAPVTAPPQAAPAGACALFRDVLIKQRGGTETEPWDQGTRTVTQRRRPSRDCFSVGADG